MSLKIRLCHDMCRLCRREHRVREVLTNNISVMSLQEFCQVHADLVVEALHNLIHASLLFGDFCQDAGDGRIVVVETACDDA